jgi:L-threonylcarbamoyladenylate synthase
MTAGPQDISRAVIRLSAGGLVAFPTETVYGLGADAGNAAAIARVFELKGRPAHNPLIVHVTGAAMARRLAHWTADAQKLVEAFWPGPLTLALPKHDSVNAMITAGGSTVALRAPDHPVTLSLIEHFGSPLVGPSANRSGRVSPTTAQHVREAFTEEQVFVLDGGPCRAGIESTVVDLSADSPRVLRPGLVSSEQIARVLGRPMAQAGDERAPDAHAPARSPGLLPQHYAPRSPAMLFESSRLNDIARALEGERVVALMISALPSTIGWTRIEMPSQARPYAARLYAALREADAMNPSMIAIERPSIGEPDADIWAAILDRLTRAARGG